MPAPMGFSLGTQEGVRLSRGKRAIGVRATEVLLYLVLGTSRNSSFINSQQKSGKILLR